MRSKRPFHTQGWIKGDVENIQQERKELENLYFTTDEKHKFKLSRGIKLIKFLRKCKFKLEAIEYLREVAMIYVKKVQESESSNIWETEGKNIIELAKKLKSKEVMCTLEKLV